MSPHPSASHRLSAFLVVVVACQLFPIRLGIHTAMPAAVLALLVWWPRRMPVASVMPVATAAVLLAYTLLVMSLQQSLDAFVIARHSRFALSALVLALLVPAAPGGAASITRAIRLSIWAHAIASALQIVYPPIRGVMAPFVGLDAERAALPLRAFGLTGSFDLAGMMLCVGVLLSLSYFFSDSRNRWIVESALLWIVGLFTGRTFWVVGSVILAIILGVALMRGRGVTRYVTVSATVVAGVFVTATIGPLLILSLFPEQALEQTAQAETALRDAGYYSGTLTTLRESILAPSGWQLVFGGGANPPWTDFGYVKLLFMNGIVGSVILLSYYILLVKPAFGALTRAPKASPFDLFAVAVFLLLLLYNGKMLVLGSRSASELFMLIGYTRLSYASGEAYEWKVNRASAAELRPASD